MISINIFQHRRNFLPLHLYVLNKLSPLWKKHIVVNVLHSGIVPEIDFDLDGLTVNYVDFGNCDNYGRKISHMTTSSANVVVKIDEDIFMGVDAWHSFLHNCLFLNHTQILTPSLACGTPQGEIFIQQFCTSKEKQYIESEILKFDHNILEKKLYTSEVVGLNKYTLEATKWDYEVYKKNVDKLDTAFKGIHPVRFTYRLQTHILDLITNNIERFLNISWTHMPENTEVFDIPYLCSGVYAMTTQEFIRMDKEFRKDKNSLEEVELNKYINHYDRQIMIDKTCYATHTIYNDVKIHDKIKLNAEEKSYLKLYEAIRNYYDPIV